ncbi:MAG: ATP-binding cassette domain-containing protein [Chloroflexi bacterium]|jgi:energy-coupling factor transport system ATP-binding protein|uniref:ABC transporter ATP-binding protein n=1 Tax=Candidatus Thermofonsia Clade 3 bacterium TaxID=2364212 RepID=A0A2M8QBU5_9CHLR|nr:ABC transporter ATP-binding protein [Candidatus Roseilinea sp. NK_OTU-006]PJF47264.1 MAG: ABC transporter ATP-binding protein [Candidatus Thermofonsia Clade 3 bacterium]RMG64673.1 MAG: ATP-binding cassette domain-containing protein [Chloroflexota bacterium]
MIALEHLTVRYVGRRQPALADLSLTLHPGETTLLLGPSGCGKSTLALTLNGLIPHSQDVATFSGRVMVNGCDTRATPPSSLAPQVGIVFQDPEAQCVMWNVADEVAFGPENLCLPPEEIRRRVGEALAAVGMAGWEGASAWQLSGGQKQRVALASLLALRPRVIVFDEPTAHLDPQGVREVFAAIAALKQGGDHTLILIEHRLDELMPMIDRVVVLGARGELIADGAPHAVFNAHFDDLRALGVWLPQVTLLGARLGLRPLPVTLEQAELALRAYVGSAFHPIGNGHQPEFRAANGPAAIEAHALTYRYGAREALREVSFAAPEGSLWAVIGSNGAGKSTLARLLAGLLPLREGALVIRGRDARRLSARDWSRAVGLVFQNPEHQFVAATVRDELRLSARAAGLDAGRREQRVDELLERFALARYANANPFTLSHGEKRRLSVATLLITDQPILLFDEPTFGQDQQNAQAIQALLASLRAEGRTIGVITHDMALAAHAQHVLVMHQGRVLAQGAPESIFADADVLRRAQLLLPPIGELGMRLGLRPLPLTVEAFAKLAQTPAYA